MDIEALMRPFDGSQVRQRTGPGRRPLEYISGPDVIRRLLDATENHFSWSVEKVQLITTDTQNGPVSLWVVLGTLSVGELGSRSGVGTHPADNGEAAKAAETDALKRAAIKFGVGLHLHEEDVNPGANNHTPSPTSVSNRGHADDTASVDPRRGGGPSQRPARIGNGYGSGNGNGNHPGNGFVGSRRNSPPSSYGANNNAMDGVGENAPF